MTTELPEGVERCAIPEGSLLRCHLRIPCGPGPKGVAFSPDSSQIWVSLLGGPPSVEIYSVATGEKLHSLDLGDNGAVEVMFSKDELMKPCSDDSSSWMLALNSR